MDLLPWDLICPRWSVTIVTGNDTLQGSVAMTGVFKHTRNQPTMLLWLSLLQVLILTMRYQSGNGYHDVPSPYTGTFMPPKPDLVFNNAPNDVETNHPAFNVKISLTKPDNDLHVVPAAVLTQSKLVPITAVRPVTTTVPNLSVTRPRQAKTIVSKPNSPPRRNINRSPSPKANTFPPKVTVVKAPM
nr:hypothetical protein [Tanacetum cinerariifolium]GFA67756.1 hypothetical protein [Tanacetum cinerariifolium]